MFIETQDGRFINAEKIRLIYVFGNELRADVDWDKTISITLGEYDTNEDAEEAKLQLAKEIIENDESIFSAPTQQEIQIRKRGWMDDYES